MKKFIAPEIARVKELQSEMRLTGSLGKLPELQMAVDALNGHFTRFSEGRVTDFGLSVGQLVSPSLVVSYERRRAALAQSDPSFASLPAATQAARIAAIPASEARRMTRKPAAAYGSGLVGGQQPQAATGFEGVMQPGSLSAQ